MPSTKPKPTKAHLNKRWMKMDEDDLHQAIVDDCLPRYPKNEPPKPVQIEAVENLVKGNHTFVMAGTGCGKSRISEMYFNLFAESQKAVILVLNPLDSLGDNQVKEKIQMGYTAVNLKNQNFNKTVASEVQRGKYNFVYLSPEVFLNNEMFTEIYYDPVFQDRLVLIVVDEAHMIYSWGLVDNGEAKKSSSHKRHQDRSVFRPSYGDLGLQLMATENTPVLLLSATCRPVAVTEILKSLKIPEENMHFVRAELTRPEIRIIRLPMEYSLLSANDLLSMFGKKEEIESAKIVPTLIYSGTRNATLQVMKVVNNAHGTPGEEYNPNSPLIHRYHASTGDMGKDDTVREFERGDFPSISCTMALGLGQNWKRVRRVIHMGRGDPSCINQMIGRCGRDGKAGLAILFMEKKRKFGLNTPEAIGKAKKQENDVRMDSLAITPVCLRIAFSIDNLHGYIPMDRDDLNYIHEEAREAEEGFLVCKCLNCAPEEAEILKNRMRYVHQENFDEFLDHPETVCGHLQTEELTKKKSRPRGKKDVPLGPIMQNLSKKLVDRFESFFIQNYGKPKLFLPESLFGAYEAEAVARNLDHIDNLDDIAKLVGGETLDGGLAMLHNCIVEFRGGIEYQEYLKEQKDYDMYIEKEIERIKNLKFKGRTSIASTASKAIPNVPAKKRAPRTLIVRSNSKSPPRDTVVAESREGTSQVRKRRSTASEVAENKKLRLMKKAIREEEEIRKKSAAKRKRDADNQDCETLRRTYAEQRSKTAIGR